MFISPSDIKLAKVMDHYSSGALKTSYSNQVYQPNLDQFTGQYKDLAAANPYANVEYKKSWWQKILSGLGFSTNYDRYLEQMNLQAREYENNLLLKQRDEAYNSPLQQAQREREAGLNPNLTGNVGPGESVPLPDDGNPPVVPEADQPFKVVEFAMSVVSGLQSAFGLASGVADLSGKLIDNRSKKLSQFTQEDNLIMDSLLNVLPPDADKHLDYNQIYSAFRKTYKGRIKKRYFPDFVNRAVAFQNGLTFSDKEYAKRDSRVGSRKGFYVKSSGSDYSEENEVMSEVSKVLSDLAIETSVLMSKASQAKSKNDIQYEESLRPEEMANKLEYEQNVDPAKIAKNELSNSDLDLSLKRNAKWQSDYQKTLNSSYKRLFDKLDKLEDNGNWFAPYAKLFISAFLLGNMPSMPVTFNTGARTNIFQK